MTTIETKQFKKGTKEAETFELPKTGYSKNVNHQKNVRICGYCDLPRIMKIIEVHPTYIKYQCTKCETLYTTPRGSVINNKSHCSICGKEIQSVSKRCRTCYLKERYEKQ